MRIQSATIGQRRHPREPLPDGAIAVLRTEGSIRVVTGRRFPRPDEEVDISWSGLKFVSLRPLPSGTRVECEVIHPEKDWQVHKMGTVRRTALHPRAPGAVIVGVEFDRE